MLSSASDTERDILSCASLTRALRSASEDMAWMIRAQLSYECTLDVAWLVPCCLEEEGQHALDARQFATVVLGVLWILAVRHLATISWVFHGCCVNFDLT